MTRAVVDSGETRPADLEFSQPKLVHWRTDGGARRGNLSEIQDYYQKLGRGRLVVQGLAGAGKTVVAMALTQSLAADFLQTQSEPPALGTETRWSRRVAVRVSAPAFDFAGAVPPGSVSSADVAKQLEKWLAEQLTSVYGVSEREAIGLVAGGCVLPVLDGVDEMDPPDEQPRRAAALLAALNRPVRSAGGLPPVILTCRTDRYHQLSARYEPTGNDRERHYSAQEPLQDATVVQLEPLSPAAAREYLLFRYPDPTGSTDGEPRWRAILARLAVAQNNYDVHLLRPAQHYAHAEDPLIVALQSPLRLFLIVHGYREPHSDPSELTRFREAEDLDRHLFGLLVPAALSLQPGLRGRRYSCEQVTLALSTLAKYLDDQSRSGGSGADIMLDQVWHAAGPRLPRLLAAVLLVSIPAVVLVWMIGVAFREANGLGVGSGVQVVALGAAQLGLLLFAYRDRTYLERYDASILRSPDRRRKLAATLALGLGAGAGVGLLAYFALQLFGRSPGLLGLLVPGLAMGFSTALGAGIEVNPEAITSPRQLVAQGLSHDIGEVALSAVWATSMLSLFSALDMPLDGIIQAWIVAAMLVVFMATSPWPRYFVACLLLARRRQFPWRLALFLTWAYEVGLLRLAGLAMQFRHREFQVWLQRKLQE